MAAPWMVEKFAGALATTGLQLLDKDEAICRSTGESQPGGGLWARRGVRQQCRWVAQNMQCQC